MSRTKMITSNSSAPIDAPEPDRRIRLAVFSEVKLHEDGSAQAIHMLRTGTFTDSAGQSFTFEPQHLESIVRNYAKRPNPPITERHDWGRAVGRVNRVWTDGQNLYGMPKWNATGRQLVADGVYDGYSCELEADGDGFVKIGGSLTNYPAVTGLEPVRLEAPVFDSAPPRVADDPATVAIQEEHPAMAEEPITPVAAPSESAPPPAAAPDLAALISQLVSNTGERSTERLTALFTQQMESQLALAQQQAEAAAARKIAEFQAQQQVAAFAQDVTTPTLKRQHALPIETDRLARFLSGLSTETRKEAQALFSHILTAGLVSFEELGAEGNPALERSAAERYQEALAAKKAAGLKHTAALEALQREQPELVSAYNLERSKGGR